jgi:hypothetical protein
LDARTVDRELTLLQSISLLLGGAAKTMPALLVSRIRVVVGVVVGVVGVVVVVGVAEGLAVAMVGREILLWHRRVAESAAAARDDVA